MHYILFLAIITLEVLFSDLNCSIPEYIHPDNVQGFNCKKARWGKSNMQ